jgi:hypothetical protein
MWFENPTKKISGIPGNENENFWKNYFLGKGNPIKHFFAN